MKYELESETEIPERPNLICAGGENYVICLVSGDWAVHVKTFDMLKSKLVCKRTDSKVRTDKVTKLRGFVGENVLVWLL